MKVSCFTTQKVFFLLLLYSFAGFNCNLIFNKPQHVARTSYNKLNPFSILKRNLNMKICVNIMFQFNNKIDFSKDYPLNRLDYKTIEITNTHFIVYANPSQNKVKNISFRIL